MADDSFHEIQLSGKQLVFLFMAITVVSVVIFLCGVLVGRGVRNQQSAELVAMSDTGVPAAVNSALVPGETMPVPEPPPSMETPAEEARDDRRDLSYPQRLERDEPPPEALRIPEEPPSPPAVDRGATAVASPEAPPGDGFTVQVAALRERDIASTMVDHLVEKGYPAYLVDPVPSAPATIYRVRVGKYESRREAEQIVRRLEEEEQFKPWITR